MRTEEKAREIRQYITQANMPNGVDKGLDLLTSKNKRSADLENIYKIVELSAMKMAEWQRQRTIDMAVEWLTLNFEEVGKSLRTDYRTKGELLSEFVNDLSR